MTTKLFTIIIPARNAAHTLPACLTALNQQTLPRHTYEIIVVDDGSTDDTAQLARQHGATCLSIVNAGPANARNVGAQQAHAPLLLFTDADCVPAPDWAETLSRAFEDPAVQGAKGIYHTHERGLVPCFVQLEYEAKYAQMLNSARIDFIDTYSAAYRREIFLANGGFDTRYPTPSVEDQEFSFRLAQQGYKLVFTTATVYHRHDLTLGEYAMRKFWIGYWKIFLLRRHPRKVLGDSHTPLSQRIQIVLLGLGLLSLPNPIWVAGFLLLFYVTALPFIYFIWQRAAWVALIAPLMLILRAGALGAGLTLGFLKTLSARNVV